VVLAREEKTKMEGRKAKTVQVKGEKLEKTVTMKTVYKAQ